MSSDFRIRKSRALFVFEQLVFADLQKFAAKEKSVFFTSVVFQGSVRIALEYRTHCDTAMSSNSREAGLFASL